MSSEHGSSTIGHEPALAFIASTEQAIRELRVGLMERQAIAASLTAEESVTSPGMNAIGETGECRIQVSLLDWPPTS